MRQTQGYQSTTVDAPPEYWTLHRIDYLIKTLDTHIEQCERLIDELASYGLLGMANEIRAVKEQYLVNQITLEKMWNDLVALPGFDQLANYFKR